MKRKLGLVCAAMLCVSVMLCLMHGSEQVYADGGYYATFNFNTDRIVEYVPESIMNGFEHRQTYEVSAGGYATAPDNPVGDYYTLEWTVNGEVVNPSTYQINANTWFVAKWTPRVYRITYVFSSDQVKSEVSNLKETDYYTVESPRLDYYTPVRANYYFVDWYRSALYKNNEKELYRPAKSIGDKLVYACFRPVVYYIDYHTSVDNPHNPDTYTVETESFDLQDVAWEGHIFRGWYSDEKLTAEIDRVDTSVGGDIDIYPKWELVKYKVTYIMPNGDKESVYCEYGKTASLPKINKSIFEVVTTDVSRNNITGNTTITIKLVNIWYVYVLAILLVGGATTWIVISIKRRNDRVNRLRVVYQSTANKRR